MPFITDDTWTPATYRRALSAWQANASTREIAPRPAEHTDTPRHDALSQRLRSLLAWRSMSRGSDWTAIAGSDDAAQDGEPAPLPIDRRLEQRPTLGELRAALEGVDFRTRRHALLGGGGAEHVVPVGGNIERGATHGQGRRPKPDCVVRLGALYFSNGAAEEPAVVLELGKAVPGAVRIELGGLVRVGKHRPRDQFGKPRGAANDNVSMTAGTSDNVNRGATDFVDPVAEEQHARWIREAVGERAAGVLDVAIIAANFREVGEHLGYAGKAAERRGKAATIEACAALDTALAA